MKVAVKTLENKSAGEVSLEKACLVSMSKKIFCTAWFSTSFISAAPVRTKPRHGAKCQVQVKSLGVKKAQAMPVLVI